QMEPMQSSATGVIDPVCGMTVNPATASHSIGHDGKDFYFCCRSCAEKFSAAPEQYLSKPVKPASGLVTLGMAAIAQPSEHQHQANAYVCPMCPEVRESKPVPCPKCGMALEPENPVAERIEYTCPMHPEIVRTEPGSCPICGMALEPRTITAHQQENPELAD